MGKGNDSKREFTLDEDITYERVDQTSYRHDDAHYIGEYVKYGTARRVTEASEDGLSYTIRYEYAVVRQQLVWVSRRREVEIVKDGAVIKDYGFYERYRLVIWVDNETYHDIMQRDTTHISPDTGMVQIPPKDSSND